MIVLSFCLTMRAFTRSDNIGKWKSLSGGGYFREGRVVSRHHLSIIELWSPRTFAVSWLRADDTAGVLMTAAIIDEKCTELP